MYLYWYTPGLSFLKKKEKNEELDHGVFMHSLFKLFSVYLHIKGWFNSLVSWQATQFAS